MTTENEQIKLLTQEINTLRLENEELKRLQGTAKDLYVQGVFDEAKKKIFEHFAPIARAVSIFSSVAITLITIVGVREFVTLSNVRKSLEEDARTAVENKVDEVTEAAKNEVDEIIRLELTKLIDDSRTRDLLRAERQEEISELKKAYDNSFVLHKNRLDAMDDEFRGETRRIDTLSARLQALETSLQNAEDKVQ